MSAGGGSLRRFAGVGLALFVVQLDYFSVSLAVPAAARHFGVTPADLQWAVSAYLLTFGALLVPLGRVGDVVGHRRVLRAALVLFGAASVACALAPDPLGLALARVGQGVAAAALFPAAFATVSTATTPDERPGVLGALIGAAGIGTSLGPVVGGLAAGSVGWPWAFWCNLPVLAVALAATRALPAAADAPTRERRRLDPVGAVGVAAGLVVLSLGVDHLPGSPLGWSGGGLVLAGVLLLAAFLAWETRARDPLLATSLLRHAVVRRSAALGALANAGLAVTVFLVTIDLQAVRGLGAVTAGAVVVVGSVALAACGPVAGRVTRRYRPGALLTAAVLAGAVAAAAMAWAGPLAVLTVAFAAAGFGCGLGYSVSQIAVQVALPPERSAAASGLLLTVLVTAGGLGVVGAGGIVDGASSTAAGVRTALLVLAALLSAGGVVAALSLVRHRRSRVATPGPRPELTGSEAP